MTARSRTGCLTCRQRKLKCDEQRPVCGQCQKGSRNCVPSDKIVFRHQQNASMNGADDADSSLKDFYRYKNSFGKDHVWVKVPNQISFVINEDPYAEGDSEVVGDDNSPADRRASLSAAMFSDYALEAAQLVQPSPGQRPTGLEALSAAATADRNNQLPPLAATSPSIGRRASVNLESTIMSVPTPSSRSSMASPPTSGLPASHQLNFILNPASQTAGSAFSPPIDPTLERSASQVHSIPSDTDIETDHETAFLLRHFSEGPGQWMDLFDLGGFFAYYIPVKALTNPLLKHAAAAYAAKQLGRVKGEKPYFGGLCGQPARMEQSPEPYNIDWENKGMQHYDKAIALLKEAMNSENSRDYGRADADSDQVWTPASQFLDPGSLGTGDKRPRSMQQQHDPASPQTYRTSSSTPSTVTTFERHKRRKVSTGKTSSDEMAAATAILCVYEFLDGSIGGWRIQLDGTKSLLDIAENNMIPLQAPHIMPRPLLSKARRATFWNFARQDFLSALITETQTRLDPEDLPMWRDAGILIDDETGFVLPSNTTASGYPEDYGVDNRTMKEDMISNALIWIMAKIVNYCVAADTPPTQVEGVPKPWEGINQITLHRKWEELQKELSVWFEGLPDTFKPCAEVIPKNRPDANTTDRRIFPEVWFSLPMCASTMQWYHYAQMLLLINQPQHSTIGKTTFHKRYGSYKSIAAEIEYHARMICSIAASRPESSVRIHMIQPLYLAGQVFDGVPERAEVIRLLRSVQTDTGWASEYRARQLEELWGWPAGGGAPALLHAVTAAAVVDHPDAV